MDSNIFEYFVEILFLSTQSWNFQKFYKEMRTTMQIQTPKYSRSFFFFLKHSTTQTLTYTCTHSPLWTHTRTPYPYEHLRNTESAGRVLRLTKSPRAPRCRRERRLPLKNIPPKWETPTSNLRFELWWAGGTTTLLTILPQASSHKPMKLEIIYWPIMYQRCLVRVYKVLWSFIKSIIIDLKK